jgi:hypothetical protein
MHDFQGKIESAVEVMEVAQQIYSSKETRRYPHFVSSTSNFARLMQETGNLEQAFMNYKRGTTRFFVCLKCEKTNILAACGGDCFGNSAAR